MNKFYTFSECSLKLNNTTRKMLSPSSPSPALYIEKDIWHFFTVDFSSTSSYSFCFSFSIHPFFTSSQFFFVFVYTSIKNLCLLLFIHSTCSWVYSCYQQKNLKKKLYWEKRDQVKLMRCLLLLMECTVLGEMTWFACKFVSRLTGNN